MNDNRFTKWLPLFAALILVGGMWLGFTLAGGRNQSPFQKKLNRLYEIIENDYVDPIDLDSLLESQIPSLLKSLDPHSSYIPAADLEKVNGELEGSFGGIGIQFQVINDTICVVEVIPGGPSEKVGVLAGDRIIAVDTIDIIKRHITDEDVRNMLRGEKGSEVSITVRRSNAAKPMTFDIVRGDIPMTSVDASYMIDPKTGYVKVNRFSRTTYGEFLQAISQLRYLGAESLIIDLRGNGGGYMEPAVLMVNEFLPAYSKIVMTKGRDEDENSTILSDGTGAFTDMPLVVLVDEFTASSSEIFSGAIQDNDSAQSCFPTPAKYVLPYNATTHPPVAASRKASSEVKPTSMTKKSSSVTAVVRYSMSTASTSTPTRCSPLSTVARSTAAVASCPTFSSLLTQQVIHHIMSTSPTPDSSRNMPTNSPTSTVKSSPRPRLSTN